MRCWGAAGTRAFQIPWRAPFIADWAGTAQLGTAKAQSSPYGPGSKTALFCSCNRKGMLLAASRGGKEQGSCQEGQTRKRYYFQWFKGLSMDEFCLSGWE